MPILPDVLQPGLRVVFCGSAVGTASARAGAYYAGPGNRFWPTLYHVGLTPVLLVPAEYPRVVEFGLGLTDIVKTHSGADADLPGAAFDVDGLRARILHYAPAILAFNGKRSATAFLRRPVTYGAQPDRVGETQLFVLPSTSGAARGFWDEGPWRDLAAACA